RHHCGRKPQALVEGDRPLVGDERAQLDRLRLLLLAPFQEALHQPAPDATPAERCFHVDAAHFCRAHWSPGGAVLPAAFDVAHDLVAHHCHPATFPLFLCRLLLKHPAEGLLPSSYGPRAIDEWVTLSILLR